MCTKTKTMFKHKDNRFDWDSSDILPHDKFLDSYELGPLYCKSGESLLHYTKLKPRLCFGVMTKIMKYKNNRDLLQIIQEHKIVQTFELCDYESLYYGPDTNKKEIYMPMIRCNYSLRQCIVHKLDFDKHKFNNNFSKKERIKSIKYFILETVGMIYQLHLNDYVHLDIKPDNIMWRFTSNPCKNQWILIDYGLTKYIAPSIGYILQNRYVGTIGYTAPEINVFANKNRPNIITKKCDIFALGASILYILNGKNIFGITKKEKQFLSTKKERFKYFYIHKLKAENRYNFATDIITKNLKDLKSKGMIDKSIYKLLLSMLNYNPLKRPSAEKIIKLKMFEKFASTSCMKYGKIHESKSSIKFHETRLPNNIKVKDLKYRWRRLTTPRYVRPLNIC
eukprot:47569_1